MKLFIVVFFLVVVASIAVSVIVNPVPSFDEQTIREGCDTDPDVLAWDRNWDPNNKILVGAYGSKDGLHEHHVEQCISDHRRNHPVGDPRN